MAAPKGSEWSDGRIAMLRRLWADHGLSAAAIGRMLGISKNAVVGKAHRLELPSRPSPINRRPAAPQPPRIPRAPRVTLPPLAATAPLDATGATEPAAAPLPVPEAAPLRRRSRAPLPTPISVGAAPSGRPAPAAPIRRTPCCWPMGEPGTPAFRFCDEASDGRTPYCEAHAAQAYAPRVERDRFDRRLLKRIPAHG